MSLSHHSPKPLRGHLHQAGGSLITSAVGVVVVLLSTGNLDGQGTIRIGFEGPPVLRPGARIEVQGYSEGGVWFGPIPGTDGFARTWSGDPQVAYNGTIAFLQATLGDSLMFGLLNSSSFTPLSVDLAGYSTVVPGPVTVPFVGYRPDGSTVTTSFTTDGIVLGPSGPGDFQTFFFPADFSDVYRVEIPAYGWSLDNLVLSVPEPSTSALLTFGAALAALGGSRRKNNN